MSTTSQLTTFADLYTDLMNRTRKDTTLTATSDQSKRYINIALHDMHISYHEIFPWAERRGVLITHPTHTTGTIATTIGSATLTGTSTVWTTSNDHGQNNAREGGKFRIDGTSEVYEALSVTAAGTATLTSNYVGATAATAAYTYFEDEYDLASDFLRPVDVHQFADNGGIRIVGRNEFRRSFNAAYYFGIPRIATILDKTSLGTTTIDTPVRRVALYPFPNVAIMINYHYSTSNLAVSSAGTAQTQLSADTDEPIVPLRYRHCILFHALYHWYRDREDDVRSQEAQAEYVNTITRIAGDTEIGPRRASFRPLVTPYRRRAHRPWSSGGGRYDLDNRFDHLEDR